MKIDNNPTQKFSFKGDVKEDIADTPGVPNVTVYIVQLNLTARTGAKGNFVFKSVPAGEYTVMFIKYGYVQVQKTVFINANERTDLSVKMTKIV